MIQPLRFAICFIAVCLTVLSVTASENPELASSLRVLDATQTAAASAAAPAATALPAPGEPVLISNSFFETDIRQALQDIATSIGQTIVIAPEVQGYVTMELKEVPLETALTLMLAGTGMTWVKKPAYYLVTTTDPTSKSFLDISETRIVRLHYIDSNTAMNMLSPQLKPYVQSSGTTSTVISQPSSGGSSSGSSFFDRSSSGNGSERAPSISNRQGMDNALSVTAPTELMDRILADLAKFDRRPQQILLDTRIVALESGDLLNLGVDWEWPSVSAGAFSDSVEHPEWPWGIRIGYTPGKEFTSSLMATLHLLSQQDQASVVANPQVMSQDGKAAQISVTNEEYFEILTRGFYSQSELERIQVGTILTIVPRLGENGEITLDMNVEVSDVVARGEKNLPVVTRRTTVNTVRVQDGGTAAIAGLVDNRNRTGDRRVPGFSSIPLVGQAFKRNTKVDTLRQVAVFVTPRILQDIQSSTDIIKDPREVQKEAQKQALQKEPPAKAVKPAIRGGRSHRRS